MDEKTLAAMLAETQQPAQKRSPLADFLMSEKDTRPYWETQHRGMVLPLVQSGYNNSVSYGVPGVLGGQGWQTMNDIVSGRSVTPDEIGHAAGDVSGAAMTGSFAGVRPSGAIGSGGRTQQQVRAYHGTGTAFDKFKPNGIGPHFGAVGQAESRLNAKNQRYASEGGADPSGYLDGSNIIPVDLNMSRVVDLPDMNAWGARQVADALSNAAPDLAGLSADVARISRDGLKRKAHQFVERDANEHIRKTLINNGYDGIKYRNKFEGDGDSYIAVAPGTVRSATTGDILYSNPKQSSAAASIDHLGKMREEARKGLPLFQLGVPMQGGGLSSPEDERQAMANYLMSGM